jgi:hypothetical protein
MKEDNGSQDVGATAFDYPTGQHPNYENRIYHTNVKVPRPNNSGAMKVNADEIMRHVNQGK